MSKSQQNYLDQVAQRLHLTADAQSGILFGMQGGLHMMLMRSTSNQNFVSLVFSLTHSGQEPDAAEIKAFVKSNKLIVNYSIRRSRVEFILKPRFGSFKQIDQLEQVTGEVVSLLRTGGYQSCCQNCGQTVETDACIMAGVPSLLCDSCYQQLGHNQEQIQQESAGKPENVLAGVVGALLGCLLGVGCIVLLGQLGYVAALSGIVLAVCTLANRIFSGYLGGQLVDALLVGGETFALMSIFGLEYAPLLAVLVGVTNIVPVLGPFLGAVPGIVILLLESPWKAAEFAIIILVVQQVDGNFIAPRILGGATGLPGLGVLLAIVVGGAWFGIPGMALGVPTLAVVAALLKQAVGAGLAARGLDADALDRDFPPMDTQN